MSGQENVSERMPMSNDYGHKTVPEPDVKYRRQIVWKNVLIMSLLHIGAAYGLLVLFQAKKRTLLFALFMYICSGLGITAGAHRLWSHKSYKAKMPLRMLLAFWNTMALQNDIIEWSRDHRVHHKFSETDADPHNATRGFFFSHVGWLLVRKHPNVISSGKKFDLSDLYADPILVFQRRYYKPLVILFCFVMPTVVPAMWGESLWVAYFTAGLLRYCLVLNATWMVNSIAHMFGNRPYDKQINPRQSIATALSALGEGWHNYHHVFPYDYRSSEFPWKLNLTTMFIDLMAVFGLAYDRKTVSESVIQQKKIRSGE